MTGIRGRRVRSVSQFVVHCLAWGMALLVLGQGAARADPLPHLPPLALKADEVTVSGLSSGAYMAGQFGIAYSASLSGAAVLAGGPYGCSKGAVSTAMFVCSCPAEKSWLLELMGLFGQGCRVLHEESYSSIGERAVERNRAGAGIDDPAHLARHRIYLLSGGHDHVVERDIVAATARMYGQLGVPPAQIRHDNLPEAGHAFPSLQAKAACGVTASPFINQCQVDTAGVLLKWLYPALEASSPAAPDEGALYEFSQGGYAGQDFTGLDTTGWVYVPKACKAPGAGCRLHVAFHGCEQGQSFPDPKKGRYGLQFVKGTGYNAWAEAARVVVLYPQVTPSTGKGPYDPYQFNPKGCWDFWGYTEKYAALKGTAPDFAKRSAPQMRAVKAMIDDLLKAP